MLLCVINVGNKKLKKARKLINGAAAMLLSPSAVTVQCMVAIKEGQVKDSANFWFKGQKALQIQKTVQVQPREIDKEMNRIMNLIMT